MKKHKFLISFFIIGVLFTGLLFGTSSFNPKEVDIIFSHDVHSFLDRLAKAKTLINEQKEKNPNTFIFDGGDFSMGTLYQTIYESQATELRTLGAIGVDATTIGNHEFDYGAKALRNMFQVALDSGDPLPEFVLCNVDTSKTDEYTKTLAPVISSYIKEYTVIEKGGVRIGVTGILGEDGIFCAPTCELTFIDQYEAVKNTVAKIKANEDVDMIVCLSHSGTNPNPKKSEDELLAKAVPDLDLIVSAHTHTRLDEPIKHGNTYIVSCGEYSQALGSLSMKQKADGRWEMTRYDLLDINDSVPDDPEIKASLDRFRGLIDSEYLSKFGYSQKQVLATSDTRLDINSEIGYLMAKGIRETVKKNEWTGDGAAANARKVDFTVVPSGCIRGTYGPGNINVGEVYESYSLGIGPDGVVGYPLVSFYLTGKELKAASELDCSVSNILTIARLFTDGLNYVYNPHRFIMNKVTDCYAIDDNGNKVPLENDKSYRIVSDLYTADMIGSVVGMTMGLVKIVPKDVNGVPISDFRKEIVYMADENGNKKEIKAWYSVARYLEEIKSIPDYSFAIDEAITASPSWNPIKLLKGPSTIGLIIYGVIIFVIALIVLIVVLIVRGCKKRKLRKIND